VLTITRGKSGEESGKRGTEGNHRNGWNRQKDKQNNTTLREIEIESSLRYILYRPSHLPSLPQALLPFPFSLYEYESHSHLVEVVG